jgi:mannose-6-phosphate isomerase-like protein (cupin superfamily)
MQARILKAAETEEYYFEEGCFILELSNSKHDPHVSIARARLQSGMSTRLHRLTHLIERYVIISGTGFVEIATLAAQKVSVGDVVIIPEFYAQKITNIGSDDLVFLAICTPRFQIQFYEDREFDTESI